MREGREIDRKERRGHKGRHKSVFLGVKVGLEREE